MPKLTCNQMMILLAIYRGTLEQELKVGTFSDDLDKLIKIGYITVKREGKFASDHDLTEKGNTRANFALCNL